MNRIEKNSLTNYFLPTTEFLPVIYINTVNVSSNSVLTYIHQCITKIGIYIPDIKTKFSPSQLILFEILISVLVMTCMQVKQFYPHGNNLCHFTLM